MRSPRLLLALLLPALALGASLVASAAQLTSASSHLTTWSLEPPTTCTLRAAADVYVDELTPLLAGDPSKLLVQSEVGANRRAFVRFDLTTCAPALRDVVHAALDLHLANAPFENRTYELRRATGAWSAETTWAEQPAVAGAATATFATGAVDGVTRAVSVTADVRAFAAGTANHGWRIHDAAEGALLRPRTAFADAGSATESLRPTLVVTYYP